MQRRRVIDRQGRLSAVLWSEILRIRAEWRLLCLGLPCRGGKHGYGANGDLLVEA
ncbi:MAG: hypothetical protein QOG14_2722 [Mycobacterium sp.]|jgi:hypothetical protein|nr:hypothetical protein [Mycobacterium sp.]